MSYRILMMSSVPLAAPWNGADKNLARLLVQWDAENQYLIHTGAEDSWPAHVIPHRSPSTGSMPTPTQKARAFGYMLRYSGDTDLVHMVASLRSPSRWTAAILRGWRSMAQKPVIHTIPSLGDLPIQRQQLIGDFTVVVSEYSRQKLENQGIQNVVRVYPPVSSKSLRPAVDSSQLALDLALGTRAILYPAHYGEKSGIHEVLQAFSRLPSSLADAVLVLACRTHPGQDPAQEAQRTMEIAAQLGIAQRVRLVGNFKEMAALISACAVTALVPGKLASKMDLPLVILESLVLKRPVIVSDLAPMNEALLGGGGFSVPYADVQALSIAMNQLLTNPNLRENLAAAGHAAVMEHCQPTRVVEQYRQIYHSTMKTKNSLAGKCL